MREVFAVTQYDGVRLEDYKGDFSLIRQRKGGDTWYPQWAKYQKGKDAFQDKAYPVKIVLGKKDEAIKLLQAIAIQIAEAEVSDVPEF